LPRPFNVLSCLLFRAGRIACDRLRRVKYDDVCLRVRAFRAGKDDSGRIFLVDRYPCKLQGASAKLPDPQENRTVVIVVPNTKLFTEAISVENSGSLVYLANWCRDQL
jgi:hypothetical protein